jgi:hypothetical protein
MADREARLAANEAIARDINEGIEEALAARTEEGHVRMICECGHLDCERVVAIRLEEYEAVRADPLRFVVVEDHVIADVEDVVDRTDRYVVVRKREGTPAAVADATDPRD